MVTDIVAERLYQQSKYSREHDDTHVDGSIAQATGMILLSLNCDATWPAELAARVRMKTRRQQLVTAAALVLAEIERLDRLP